MEELTKRNGKGVWLREIDKGLKRFNASLEWLLERISLRDEELEVLRQNMDMDQREKDAILGAKRMKCIAEVLEEMDTLIDIHFYSEFSKTQSSLFLKRVRENQNAIDVGTLKKTWRTLNCSPKTMKIIREIQENLLCVGKRKELITKKRAETKCWCNKAGLSLNAKHIISCCRKVSAEINNRHDIVVNILLSNILVQREVIAHEQKWDDRRMVRSSQRRHHHRDRTLEVR